MNTAKELTQLAHDVVASKQFRAPALLALDLVDAVVAAGYRKPSRVNTHKELAAMPDGTVIRDWNGGVGEKRDWPLDLAVRYVNGITCTNHDIALPATVLYIPEKAEERCPSCAGLNGSHSFVHVRHGNGGGHNEPCPRQQDRVRSDEQRQHRDRADVQPRWPRGADRPPRHQSPLSAR